MVIMRRPVGRACITCGFGGNDCSIINCHSLRLVSTEVSSDVLQSASVDASIRRQFAVTKNLLLCRLVSSTFRKYLDVRTCLWTAADRLNTNAQCLQSQ